MDENDNVLIIEVSGNRSDLEFVRERCFAAVQETVDEYEENLEHDVEVDWRWKV